MSGGGRREREGESELGREEKREGWDEDGRGREEGERGREGERERWKEREGNA